MTDLESIRKRHEAAVNLARDLQHATLHGPVPIATTMQMAHELVWASAENVRLTIERDDYASQAKAERGRWRPISERAERAEVVAKSIRAALGHGADDNMWPVGLTVAGAVARLVDRVATAKDEERAAVVAHADAEAARMTGNGDDVGARFVRAFGDAIESNRHREKA